MPSLRLTADGCGETDSPAERTGFELAVPGLCSAIDPIKRLVEHGFMPGAVPRLDIGLDPGEEVGTRPLPVSYTHLTLPTTPYV